MPRSLLRALARGVAAALTAALLSASAPAAEASCASIPRGPVVLTTARTVPAGGGVLVETHAVIAGDAARASHAYALVAGGVSVAPVALAPGLVVYRIPFDATSATLTDGTTTVRTITMSRAMAKARTLPAPKVKEITDDTQRSDDPRGIGARARTTVVLTAAPPAGAVALIAYDAGGHARSYALVGAGAKTIVVYDHGRCDEEPPGTAGLGAGEQTTLAWVDAAGLVGARSKPAAVRAPPRP